MSSLDSRFRGNDSPPKLDTAILQKLVVEDILKIGPQDIAEFITYTRETDVAVKLVDEKTCACAFFLNPTRLEQVRDMSLARIKMPQKSTYFYPKLLTGLVMRKL